MWLVRLTKVYWWLFSSYNKESKAYRVCKPGKVGKSNNVGKTDIVGKLDIEHKPGRAVKSCKGRCFLNCFVLCFARVISMPIINWKFPPKGMVGTWLVR